MRPLRGRSRAPGFGANRRRGPRRRPAGTPPSGRRRRARTPGPAARGSPTASGTTRSGPPQRRAARPWSRPLSGSCEPVHPGLDLGELLVDLPVVSRADPAFIAPGQLLDSGHRPQALGDAVEVDRRRRPVAEVPVGRQRVVGDHEGPCGRLHNDDLHAGRVSPDPLEVHAIDQAEVPIDDLQAAARVDGLQIAVEAVADEPPDPRIPPAGPAPEIQLALLDPERRLRKEPFQVEVVPVQVGEDDGLDLTRIDLRGRKKRFPRPELLHRGALDPAEARGEPRVDEDRGPRPPQQPEEIRRGGRFPHRPQVEPGGPVARDRPRAQRIDLVGRCHDPLLLEFLRRRPRYPCYTTRWTTVPVARKRVTFSAHMLSPLARASGVVPAVCGVSTTFGAPSRGLSRATGSLASTSIPAPIRGPDRRASASAASSTMSPRAVLMKIAPRRIRMNWAGPRRPRVSGLDRRWSETTSAPPSNASRVGT